MKKYGNIIVKRSINIIIMMIPSLLWGTLLMYDICFGITHAIFSIITYCIMGLLCFTMLFLNSILIINFPENSFEHMQYCFVKMSKMDLCYSVITRTPLILILFLTPIWVFLSYGIIQFLYILIDRKHMSIMERIYYLCHTGIICLKNRHLKKNIENQPVSLS